MGSPADYFIILLLIGVGAGVIKALERIAALEKAVAALKREVE